SETLPVMLPVFAGAKATLKFVFCPGVRVRGKLSPPTLRPLPEAWTWARLNLALPVFVKVVFYLLRIPTPTFPKLALGGVTEICGCCGWTPVPLGALVFPTRRSSDLSETLPVMLPLLAGAKTTLKFVFCPGVRVRGRLSPPTLRPLPETLAWETVTLALPELVMVKA